MGTYNTYPQDPNFPLLTAIDFDRSADGELFGNDDYFRIGDSAFQVHPDDIAVYDVTNNHVEPILRTPGGIAMSTSFVEKTVVVNFTFTNVEAIFGLGLTDSTADDVEARRFANGFLPSPPINPASLAALIAQFKRTPVMPVVNIFLNSVHEIKALAVTNIAVETKKDEDGHPSPNVVGVVLTAKAFDISSFCPTLIDFSASLNYPMLRWYWRQEYAQWLPGQFRVAAKGGTTLEQPVLTPTQLATVKTTPGGEYAIFTRRPIGGMTGDFQFLTVNPEWLQALDAQRKMFNQAQAYSLSDNLRLNGLPGDQTIANAKAQVLFDDLNKLADDANAKMDPVDCGSNVVLTSLNCTMDNYFSTIRPPDSKTPSYQHMAQGNVRIVAQFFCEGFGGLASLHKIIENARESTRLSRFELIGGFVGFENEITSLFGVHSVVFTNISTQNVADMPNCYYMTIEMISFDRNQKQIEALKNSANLPDIYLNQTLSGNKTPYSNNTAIDDPQYKFWARYNSYYKPEKDPKQPSADPKAFGFDPTGRPINAWFNMAYIQEAKELMSALEMYPDLRLPTYERLKYAINNNEIYDSTIDSATLTKIKVFQELRWTYWTDKGRFVDPDFYVDYPNKELASIQPNANVDSTLGPSNLYETIINELDPNVAVNVMGSISDSVKASFADKFPDGVYLGPDLNAEQKGPDLSDPPKDNAPTTTSDTGPAAGKPFRHATVTMPGKGDTKTNVVSSSFYAPTFTDTSVIQGQNYTITHPSGGLNPKEFGDEKSWTKIKGAPDMVIDSAAILLGKKNEPGKDNRPLLNMAVMNNHPVDVGYQITSEYDRLVASCNDLITYDVTARLVQAFPAYVFQLLDEGPRMGFVNLMPNFMALQSIQSIDVINDRRDPAHTAEITLINTYGNLNSYTQGQLSQNAVLALTNPVGFVPTFNEIIKNGGNLGIPTSGVDLKTLDSATEAISNNLNNWIDGIYNSVRLLIPTNGMIQNASELRRRKTSQVMLAPGTRVHIRLGYGSNGARFPVTFNGRITDVGLGEKVVITAMGDGLELAKIIPGSESETASLNPTHTGFLQIATSLIENAFHGDFTIPSSAIEDTYEPRELICNMLASHGEDLFDYSLGTDFWNSIKGVLYRASGGGFFSENPIGISHFGNPYLFQLWDQIYGKDINAPTPTSDSIKTDGPNELALFGYLIGELQVPFLSGTAKLKDLNLVANLLNVPGSDITLGVFNPGLAPANILSAGIGAGFGETGENVYNLYDMFDKTYRRIGSFSSEGGIGYIANLALSTAVSGAGDTSQLAAAYQDTFNNDAYEIPPLPDISCTPSIGDNIPHNTFNMYVKNKSVWDIVTTMAQYSPPYVAAVVPFEYRSTLFFGAQYYGFRYDYTRVSAIDLGELTSADDIKKLDKYYGYPVAYKVKPFSQFHFYDSKQNLLNNTIRASDEETYTDVMMMWYNGQGYRDGRPAPYGERQTVDREVASAYRKTAIVNTDLLGLDVAPTPAAVLGSCGLDWAAYMGENIGWGGFTIAGWVGHAQTVDAMRKTCRAILRDYQKLMYQGEILVLGDPTVKPHDVIYINDDYTDIKGLASVRRVVHHFGIDTGFVTSISPDLLCEVKGENFWLSMWTWWGGFIATNVIARKAAVFGLAKALTKFNDSITNFGLKVTKDSNFKTVLRFLTKGRLGAPDPTKQIFYLAGKKWTQYEPRFFTYQLRQLFLNSLNAGLKVTKKGTALGADLFGIDAAKFADLASNITDAAKKAGSIVGEKTINSAAAQKYVTTVINGVSKAIDESGVKGIQESFVKALSQNLIKVNSNISIEAVIDKTFSQLIATKAIAKLGLQDSATLDSKLLAGEIIDLSDEAKAIIAKVGPGATLESVIGQATADAAAPEVVSELTELLPILTKARFIASFSPIGLVINIAIQITIGYLWTAVERYWDDQTSLQICFLNYRGGEFQAGLNGHSETILFRADDPGFKDLVIDEKGMQTQHATGGIQMKDIYKNMITVNGQTSGPATIGLGLPDPVTATGSGPPLAGNLSPVTPLAPGAKYTTAQRAAIIAKHDLSYNPVTLLNELLSGAGVGVRGSTGTSDTVISFLDYASQNGFKLFITAAASGSHPSNYATSDHELGYAIDVGYISLNGGPQTSVGEKVEPVGQAYINLALKFGVHQIGAEAWLIAGVYKAYSQVINGANFNEDSADHIHVDMGK